MSSTLSTLAVATASIALIHYFIIHPLFLSPLSRIPGPKAFALTKWRLAWEDLTGRRTRTIHALHALYGPVVRIGPNEVHFNSHSALRTIYGAGSGFERTTFYRMFDVYGKQNLFTFHGTAEHAARKKLLAHAYSKSAIIRGPVAAMVESKIHDFLALLSPSATTPMEIFTALHHYSLDAITTFLYGAPAFGATTCLRGTPAHRALLDDILDPARRRLTWFAVHLPALTRWLYAQTGVVIGQLVAPLLPMRRPATYTGIRAHALRAMRAYAAAAPAARAAAKGSIVARLWEVREGAGGGGGLGDLDVASECADHLLAGIDTTSDTLMFLVWALSRPENAGVQERLVEECRALGEAAVSAGGAVSVEAGDRMAFLEAVVRETLRLFAPLPASEPRTCLVDVVVDGYVIPGGTVCAMAPFSLHRNADVFAEPERWDPERWLRGDEKTLAEMKKWYWPFSSGGRMCIGMHLALAEMALVPSIYRKYSTRIKPGFEDISPGITSRFEVFGDDALPKTEEHTCWIEFIPHDAQ